VRDGDVYIVNGQKIWTSLADTAKFGILIARTNPDVPKHTGISYFIIPMDLPGIEVRPIRNMTGGAGFNEVFFTDVRVPVENLIGERTAVGDGEDHPRVTSGVALQRGLQGRRSDCPRSRGSHGIAERRRQRALRQRLVQAFIMGEILRYHHLQMLSAAVNKRPAPTRRCARRWPTRTARSCSTWRRTHGRRRPAQPGRARARPSGSNGRAGSCSALRHRGGGTSEVLRNIIAERCSVAARPDASRVRTGRRLATAAARPLTGPLADLPAR
jgi:alkylation response protein AidB-like acyl-CoA dehydrogenase